MLRAELALVAVTFVWGTSFTVIKGALDEVPPLLLIALRFAVAAAVLLALRPRSIRALRPGVLLGAAPLGLLLFAAYGLQTWGLAFTTPSRSAFLTATSVLLVPLLGRPLYGVPIERDGLLGAALALLGILLLTRPGGDVAFGWGELLTGLCAVAYALHILVLGAQAGRGGSARELAFVQMVWVVLVGVPLSAAVERPELRLGADAWAAAVYLGVFCSALAIGVQTWAQRRTPAGRAALIFALEPVFAALIAAVAWGERMSGVEILGGACVVLGVVVARPRSPGEAVVDASL